MKIVINNCYGGFSLSRKAVKLYLEKKGKELFAFKDGKLLTDEDEDSLFEHFYLDREQKEYFCDRDIERDDPDLIKVVEELGKQANGSFAELKIVEIPDDVKWVIEEYDGIEWISEEHKTWG